MSWWDDWLSLVQVRVEAHGHVVGVGDFADADAHVVAFAHQVHHAVGEVEGQLDVRVQGPEAGAVGGHVAAPRDDWGDLLDQGGGGEAALFGQRSSA